MSVLCIFHKDCFDGFAAAWAVKKSLPDAELYGAKYGLAPPDVSRRDVVLVDFCYKREQMMEIASAAQSVLVLDHHVSAMKDIGPLPKAAKVKLSNGNISYVDIEDIALVEQYKWSEQAHGGAVAYIGGGRQGAKYTSMHRLIMQAQEGDIVDHRNRNPLDNRRCNLRFATKSENGANMDRGSSTKGVTRRGSRWIAQITVQGLHRYLGMYDSEKEAGAAYVAAATEAFGEFARHVQIEEQIFPPNCHFIFDMERSGAGIAWDFFHPNESRPHLINYIEDRDLWRFALPASREIHGGLATYPFDLSVYDELMGGGLLTIQSLATMGEVLERKQKQDLVVLPPISTRTMRIGGYDVPVANVPITMCSDAGNMLSEGHPFAATYFDGPDGRSFSLRSQKDGIDVSEIAKKYGGGGHAHASGFKRVIGWEGDTVLGPALTWP